MPAVSHAERSVAGYATRSRSIPTLTMRTRERYFFTYILGSLSGTFYVGFTSDMETRSIQHKEGIYEGFTKKYGVDRLLYYETFDDPRRGIAREKQLKGWSRAKKTVLIEKVNPEWKDMSRQWYEELLRRRAKWMESLRKARERDG
jgi:putative endonuclease